MGQPEQSGSRNKSCPVLPICASRSSASANATKLHRTLFLHPSLLPFWLCDPLPSYYPHPSGVNLLRAFEEVVALVTARFVPAADATGLQRGQHVEGGMNMRTDKTKGESVVLCSTFAMPWSGTSPVPHCARLYCWSVSQGAHRPHGGASHRPRCAPL